MSAKTFILFRVKRRIERREENERKNSLDFYMFDYIHKGGIYTSWAMLDKEVIPNIMLSTYP